MATVNASGYVFGQHAGTAVITATYTSASGISVSENCTVYVTVADGLYYMKNASSDLCFYTGGSAVSLQAQQTDASSRVGQLWKIRYVADGKYEICPIRDTSVALTANDGNYVVVGETETVASWGLIQNANGYAIAYLGSSAEIAKPVVASMPGTQIYLGEWQDALTCHWNLEPAAGLFLRDAQSKVLVHSSDVRYMELDDDTATWADLGILYESYGSIAGSVTRYSSDSSVVDFNTYGVLEASTHGRVTITVSVDLDVGFYTQEFDLIVRETISVINLYDSTIAGDDEILGNIETAVDFLNEIYDEYYLYFASEDDPVQDPYAAVDVCPHINDRVCNDSCGTDCETHHLNVNRIANDLYGRHWRKNKVVVMWSNSEIGTFCSEVGQEGIPGVVTYHHFPALAYAIAPSKENEEGVLVNQPIVLMLTINNLDDATILQNRDCTDLQFMSIVLAHEIAHTLGLEEMYGNAAYPDHDVVKGMECIMESIEEEEIQYLNDLYSKIMEHGVSAFCETCLDKLDCIPDNAYEN